MNKLWGMIVISLGINGMMLAEPTKEIEEVVDQNLMLEEIEITKDLTLEEKEITKEWRHIVEATKKLATDQEMQKAVRATVTAFEKMLSLGVKKVARQVSPTEKEMIVILMQLLNRVVDIHSDSIRSGVALDHEAAEELRQLDQALIMLVAPLLLLRQDRVFIGEQMPLVRDFRIEIYNSLQRILNTLNAEL